MTAVATVISNVITSTHRKMINQGVPSLFHLGQFLNPILFMASLCILGDLY